MQLHFPSTHRSLMTRWSSATLGSESTKKLYSPHCVRYSLSFIDINQCTFHHLVFSALVPVGRVSTAESYLAPRHEKHACHQLSSYLRGRQVVTRFMLRYTSISDTYTRRIHPVLRESEGGTRAPAVSSTARMRRRRVYFRSPSSPAVPAGSLDATVC